MAVELDNIKALLESTSIFDLESFKTEKSIITCKALPGYGDCEFMFYTASISFAKREKPRTNSNVVMPNESMDMYNTIVSKNNIKIFMLCNLSDYKYYNDPTNWMNDFVLFVECFNNDVLKGETTSANGVSSITFAPSYEQDVKTLASDIRIISNDKYRFIFVRKDPAVLAHFLLSADNRTYAKRITNSIQYIPVEQRGEIHKTIGGFKHNLIINGAPGTGKSRYIKDKTDEYFKKIADAAKSEKVTVEQLRSEYITRVTFYEDYSYENFVGCYKPVEADDKKSIELSGQSGAVSGKRVSYRFEPGPFITAYINAIKAENAEKNSGAAYFLVIEEINRAKAASVFGDIFQLLDRDENGESEYSITPEPALAAYLAEQLGDDFDGTMKLPSNLYIWATMNSADQGVFPLDSAFKRRWSFIYRDVTAPHSPAAVTKICLYHNGKPQEVLWDDFRKVINNAILANNYDEDRCIGAWYFKDSELLDIKEFTLCDDAEKRNSMSNPLVDKLLMYLRQDVFRMNADEFFNKDYLSMTQIRMAFSGDETNGGKSNPVDIEDIFVTEIANALNALNWQSPAMPSPADNATAPANDAAIPADNAATTTDEAAVTADGNSDE